MATHEVGVAVGSRVGGDVICDFAGSTVVEERLVSASELRAGCPISVLEAQRGAVNVGILVRPSEHSVQHL